MGFPGGSDGKESACNVGDLGSVRGLGRSPGERNSYPPQDSSLENSITKCKKRRIKSTTYANWRKLGKIVSTGTPKKLGPSTSGL